MDVTAVLSVTTAHEHLGRRNVLHAKGDCGLAEVYALGIKCACTAAQCDVSKACQTLTAGQNHPSFRLMLHWVRWLDHKVWG